MSRIIENGKLIPLFFLSVSIITFNGPFFHIATKGLSFWLELKRKKRKILPLYSLIITIFTPTIFLNRTFFLTYKLKLFFSTFFILFLKFCYPESKMNEFLNYISYSPTLNYPQSYILWNISTLLSFDCI